MTGVNASVINKGDGTYSLVVRSDTGRNNAIRLTVTENLGDTGLSTLDTSCILIKHLLQMQFVS